MAVLLPGESTWAEERVRLQSMGSQSQTQMQLSDLHIHTHIYIHSHIIILELYIYIYTHIIAYHRASQVVLVVKNPPVNAGDVRDMHLIPGSGRALEKGIVTHASTLA